MNNIEMFNVCTAYLFSKLYENFPQRVDINNSELAEAVVQASNPDSSPEAEFDRAFDAHRFCEETLRWLEYTGYVDVGDWSRTGDGDAREVVLMPKALEALKATPASISEEAPEGRTIGDALGEAVRSGSMDAAKQLVSKGFTSIARLTLTGMA